jgi:hypothetical protein
MKHPFSLLLPLVACVGVLIAGRTAPGQLRWRAQLLHRDFNEGLALGDVNGDGKTDIVAGGFWYEAPEYKQRLLRPMARFGADYLQNNADHLHDVNGDGRPDIVTMGFTEPGIFWYENPGPGNFDNSEGWKKHQLADTGGRQNEVTFLRDLDGDGTSEIIVNSWNAGNPTEAWRFGKDGDGRPVLNRHLIGKGRNGHGMGFGDINDDGLEDIIFMQGWFERPKDGPFSGEWAFHGDFTFPQASCPMLVVDLDGDGRNDIIRAHGHDYGLWWEQQLAPKEDGTTLWKSHSIDDTFSQAHALAWEDIDRDGVPELITGKRYRAHSSDPGTEDAATVHYYDWHKDRLAWTKTAITGGEPGKGPGIGLQIRTADLDGNGWLDLALPGKSGTFILWNDGP